MMLHRLGLCVLVALDFDRRIRANNRTFAATRTIVANLSRRVIALGVGFLRNSYAVFGTDRNAQATAFALLGINDYLASHVYYLLLCVASKNTSTIYAKAGF